MHRDGMVLWSFGNTSAFIQHHQKLRHRSRSGIKQGLTSPGGWEAHVNCSTNHGGTQVWELTSKAITVLEAVGPAELHGTQPKAPADRPISCSKQLQWVVPVSVKIADFCKRAEMQKVAANSHIHALPYSEHSQTTLALSKALNCLACC